MRKWDRSSKIRNVICLLLRRKYISFWFYGISTRQNQQDSKVKTRVQAQNCNHTFSFFHSSASSCIADIYRTKYTVKSLCYWYLVSGSIRGLGLLLYRLVWFTTDKQFNPSLYHFLWSVSSLLPSLSFLSLHFTFPNRRSCPLRSSFPRVSALCEIIRVRHSALYCI